MRMAATFCCNHAFALFLKNFLKNRNIFMVYQTHESVNSNQYKQKSLGLLPKAFNYIITKRLSKNKSKQKE